MVYSNKLIPFLNENKYSLSHGAYWNVKINNEPYLSNYYLFMLQHGEINSLNQSSEFETNIDALMDMDFLIKHLHGGLYAKVIVGSFDDDISKSVDRFLDSDNFIKTFTLDTKPCIEMYRDFNWYTQCLNGAELYFPVQLKNSLDPVHICNYCGNTFVGDAKEICVCNEQATKIRLTEDGEIYFIRNGKK